MSLLCLQITNLFIMTQGPSKFSAHLTSLFLLPTPPGCMFEAVLEEAAPGVLNWCGYHCPAMMAPELSPGFERHLMAAQEPI